jgi:cytochrome c553
VPACSSCHAGSPRNPVYPDLDNQHAPYLEGQLRLFQSGNRGGTPYSHIMEVAAQRLSEEDIKAVAAYFSSRPR